jgi:hypothetical protein
MLASTMLPTMNTKLEDKFMKLYLNKYLTKINGGGVG